MAYKLFNDDCLNILSTIKKRENVIIVSDPPFNIGYKYNTYKDNLSSSQYYEMLATIFSDTPSVVILYPEILYNFAICIKKAPCKVVSWCYNSNTARQHRDIAFFDIKPNFNLIKQPYKNQNDKRIKALIQAGKTGAKLYDWWNVNQVKNVSKEKTKHPCQMPLKIMENIVGILPKNALILDPFMGSGTTGVACINTGRDFIGIEIDEDYFNIAKERIENTEANYSVERIE